LHHVNSLYTKLFNWNLIFTKSTHIFHRSIVISAQESFNKLSYLGVHFWSILHMYRSRCRVKIGGLIHKMGHLHELNSSLLFNLSSYKVGLSRKQPKAKPYHVGKTIANKAAQVQDPKSSCTFSKSFVNRNKMHT